MDTGIMALKQDMGLSMRGTLGTLTGTQGYYAGNYSGAHCESPTSFTAASRSWYVVAGASSVWTVCVSVCVCVCACLFAADP